MGFLKKIRNNILNQQNSFHVGFGNRSPFSYKGKYSGDWTPEVPNLVIPKPVIQTPVLDAEINLVGKVADVVTKVAKAAIEHKVDDPNKKSESKNKLQTDYNVKKEFRKVGENVEEITNPTEPTTTEIKGDFDKQMCWSNGGVWQSKQGVPGGKCSK